MQRTINEVVASSDKYDTNKDFAEKAIENNIYDIMEMLSGYKDISYFIKYLNEDITWIEIQNPEVDINSKLMPDKNLTSQLLVEISKQADSVLCKASNISSMPKSDIMRFCLLKELYEVSNDILNDTRFRRISDRWTIVRSKLKKANMLLIHKLKLDLSAEIVEEKLDQEHERYNLVDITRHYQDFKNSEGFNTMKDTEQGKDVIEVLERIKSSVSNSI